MPASAPRVVLSPQVCRAFDEGCRAVFRADGPRRHAGEAQVDLLLRFAAQYERLVAMPRRLRRALQRQWHRNLSAVALLLALGPAPAWAATIAVTPATPPAINADGRCSLMEAIVNANRNLRTHLDCVAGSGTVDTIVLPANSGQLLHGTQSVPAITSKIVIEGRGSTIARDVAAVAPFLVVAANGDLTLRDTTISGEAGGIHERGYAVSSTGRVVLERSHAEFTDGLVNTGGTMELTDSSVTDGVGLYVPSGGGIRNTSGGSLVVTNSVIARNQAVFDGGGIVNDTGSSARLVDSVVADNRISYEGNGGGIWNRGTLFLSGTTVSGNQADAAGGISNQGTATIRRSTISGNRLNNEYDYLGGAGIANIGTLTLANSTVSNNEARSAYGGGLISYDGSASIDSSTITGNSVSAPGYDAKGGGVFARAGKLTIERSIVSGNIGPKAPEVFADPGVDVVADDYNVFGHDGDSGVLGFVPGSSDIVPNKPVGGILLPLADNGGPTLTHALAMASPALDASPDDAGCPNVDQRDSPRSRGPRCDIGSFEGAAVTCGGRVTTQVGTDGPDELTGTPGPDVIAGLNGDDSIGGLDGNDVVCGGGGNDSVFGGAGNDVLAGQGGNDRLFGHRGADTLDGGPATDQCDGGADADTATTCESVSGVP